VLKGGERRAQKRFSTEFTEIAESGNNPAEVGLNL
jgi:hypothetical protein